MLRRLGPRGLPHDQREPRQAEAARDRALPGRRPRGRRRPPHLRPHPLRSALRLRPRRGSRRTSRGSSSEDGVLVCECAGREPPPEMPGLERTHLAQVRLRTAYAVRAVITAIYPGTYDPVTNGHVDVISRAGADLRPRRRRRRRQPAPQDAALRGRRARRADQGGARRDRRRTSRSTSSASSSSISPAAGTRG